MVDFIFIKYNWFAINREEGIAKWFSKWLSQTFHTTAFHDIL